MQKLATVAKLRDFPVADNAEEVKRPYRLWDSNKKGEVRWAYFKNLRHAHMRALYEAAWSNGDSVFEVYDVRTGGLRGQYRRHGQDIKFWRSTHPIEDE
jgi:hypothetical protein